MKHARDPSPDAATPKPIEDRRQFHRIPCNVGAFLISTALGRVRANVIEMSQGGCRITTRARCRPGEHFVLKLEPMGPKLVAVIWANGETVGLAFADPIGWDAISQIVFGGPVEWAAARYERRT